jgi:hypothetical protein
MKRTFNYTGRQRVTKDEIDMSPIPEGRGVYITLNLGERELPSRSKVYFHAKSGLEFERFGPYSLSDLARPTKLDLGRFQKPDRVDFSVKVSDPHDGKLLASGKNLHKLAGFESSLLPMKAVEIESAWRLRFDDDDDEGPILVYKDSPNMEKFIRNREVFQALLMPEVLRQILTVIAGNRSRNRGMESWEENWMKFATGLIGRGDVHNLGAEEVTEWIDDVVGEFCVKHGLAAALNGYLEEHYEALDV